LQFFCDAANVNYVFSREWTLRVRLIVYSTIALIAGSPAFAEVCDKERPSWDPSSGSINRFEELYFFFTSPLGVGLVCLIAVTLYVNQRWLSILCAGVFLLTGVLTAAVWFWVGDGIVYAAFEEGCRAEPYVTIGVLGLLSLWLYQYGRPRITQRLNTINLGDDLDDVEMLMAIEEVFGIEVEDSEAETLISMGDLYELLINKLKLKTNFDPVWALVCQIAREHSGSRDPIDKQTTFFPKFAKERIGPSKTLNVPENSD
jgi:acyl carrier protein